MLTVGMLGHLSRTPRAKYKDSAVKDLVILKAGERKGGREEGEDNMAQTAKEREKTDWPIFRGDLAG